MMCLLSFSCYDFLCLAVVDVETGGRSVENERDEEVGRASTEVALLGEFAIDVEELVVHVFTARVVVLAASFGVVGCGISSEA